MIVFDIVKLALTLCDGVTIFGLNDYCYVP